MEVFVFDLDFTLWNAGDTWCSETQPPYIWVDGKLVDLEGRWIRLYPETRHVLEFLKNETKTIAVASRTHQPEWANQLLLLLEIDGYFDVKEIYPGSKLVHLKSIAEKTKCPLNQIVFFDDEERNTNEVKLLGIKSILIKNGIKVESVRNFIE